MVINRNVMFIVAAIILFVIAFLLSAGALSGGSASTWGFAGLACFAAGHLP